MTYKELQERGEKFGSELEGTVIFYLYNGVEFAVLQDNTIICKKEWDRGEGKK